ncbi:unnamed protein product [Lota lota]
MDSVTFMWSLLLKAGATLLLSRSRGLSGLTSCGLTIRGLTLALRPSLNDGGGEAARVEDNDRPSSPANASYNRDHGTPLQKVSRCRPVIGSPCSRITWAVFDYVLEWKDGSRSPRRITGN